MLSPGTRLGPYEAVALIGTGGTGEVYRARDPRLGREVAVKVLQTAFSADPDRLRRFEQEARAAATLNHPNILAVYDIGTSGFFTSTWIQACGLIHSIFVTVPRNSTRFEPIVVAGDLPVRRECYTSQYEDYCNNY